jgi:hypothetical protein
MSSFYNLYLSSLHSREKVASLPHPTLLFNVSFECSVSCMLDVRVKRLLPQGWENSPLFATKIVVCFKGLGSRVIFLLRTTADVFFVWCRRTPLDEPCMALQTLWLMSIGVCTSRLAFTRCPPSILEKKSSYGRLLPFFIIVPVFLQKKTCAFFSVQTSFDSFAFVVSFFLWHCWKTLSARTCECWIDSNASSSIQCFDDDLYILMKFLISTCWALIRNFMIANNCCWIVLGLYYVCAYHTLRGSPNLPSNLHLASNISHNTVKRINLS